MWLKNKKARNVKNATENEGNVADVVIKEQEVAFQKRNSNLMLKIICILS